MKLPDAFDFTQSNLQDYVECPYRFYMRYYLRTKWPALVVDDALEFEQRTQSGARFHRLIQQYLIGVPEGRLTEIANADTEQLIAAWWDDFLIHVPPLFDGEKFIETTLSTFLGGRRLVAKYDLILVNPSGKLVIFDWKTSQKKISKEMLLERIQTRLYRLIMTLAGNMLTGEHDIAPNRIEMNYWFAPHPETLITLSYDDVQFQEDQAYFTNLIEEIQQRSVEAFERTQDIRKCRFCIYRSHCDRGTSAGHLDAFDDFDLNTEEETPDLEYDEIEEIAF